MHFDSVSEEAVSLPYSLGRNLFELLLKIAVVVVIVACTFQSINAAFLHIPRPWSYYLNFSALLILLSALLTCWFALESHKSTIFYLKVGYLNVLGVALLTIFMLAVRDTTLLYTWMTGIFLLLVFARCLLTAFDPFYCSSHTLSAQPSSNSKLFSEIRTNQRGAIAQLKSEIRKSSLERKLNDMINRAHLEHNHEEALQEVEVMKKQLIEKAYAKHHLAMAQLASRFADTSNYTHPHFSEHPPSESTLERALQA